MSASRSNEMRYTQLALAVMSKCTCKQPSPAAIDRCKKLPLFTSEMKRCFACARCEGGCGNATVAAGSSEHGHLTQQLCQQRRGCSIMASTRARAEKKR